MGVESTSMELALEVSSESIGLFNLGQALRSAFHDLCKQDSQTQLASALERCQQDFLLWAVNLGLFDHGHKSLDYRLQDTPDTKELITDLLEELQSNIDGLRACLAQATAADENCVHGNTTLPVADEKSKNEDDHDHNRDEDEDEADEGDEDETAARLDALQDIQKRLFRLAHSIRKPSTRSAVGTRNIYRIIDKSYREDAVKQLRTIEFIRIRDFVTQTRRELSLKPDSAEIELNEMDNTLIRRLAQANSFRRQQFMYWRERHSESETSAAVKIVPPEHEPQLLPVVVTDRHTQPKHENHPQLSMPSSVTKLQPNQIKFNDRKSVASHDTRAPSTYGPAGEKAEWPLLSTDIKSGPSGYFTCPYCYNLCPSRYRDKEGWKQHLINDLRPYCCTYDNCDSNQHLYESFGQWRAHESLVHNSVVVCLEHSDSDSLSPVFDDAESYRSHVKAVHPAAATDMLKSEIITSRTQGSTRSNRICPICLASIEDAKSMSVHVAWHLEVIALMTLPRSTGLEQDSDAGDLRSNAMTEADQDSRHDMQQLSLPGSQDDSYKAEEQPPDQGYIYNGFRAVIEDFGSQVDALIEQLNPAEVDVLEELYHASKEDWYRITAGLSELSLLLADGAQPVLFGADKREFFIVAERIFGRYHKIFWHIAAERSRLARSRSLTEDFIDLMVRLKVLTELPWRKLFESEDEFRLFVSDLRSMDSAVRDCVDRIISSSKAKYICDYPGCTTVFNGFATSEGLQSHMVETHKLADSWVCYHSDCETGSQTWPDENGLRLHVSIQHPLANVDELLQNSITWHVNRQLLVGRNLASQTPTNSDNEAHQSFDSADPGTSSSMAYQAYATFDREWRPKTESLFKSIKLYLQQQWKECTNLSEGIILQIIEAADLIETQGEDAAIKERNILIDAAQATLKQLNPAKRGLKILSRFYVPSSSQGPTSPPRPRSSSDPLSALRQIQELRERFDRRWRPNSEAFLRSFHSELQLYLNRYSAVIEAMTRLAEVIALTDPKDDQATLEERMKLVDATKPTLERLNALKNDLQILRDAFTAPEPNRTHTDSEAIGKARAAFLDAKETKGRRHERTLHLGLFLSNKLYQEGQLQEAETILRDVNESCEAGLGLKDTTKIVCLWKLSDILEDTGRYSEAEHWLREVWSAQANTYIENHPETLRTMARLGRVMKKQEKLYEAATMFQQVLESHIGRSGNDTLGVVNDLMATLIDLGGVRDAQDLGMRYAEYFETPAGLMLAPDGGRLKDIFKANMALATQIAESLTEEQQQSTESPTVTQTEADIEESSHQSTEEAESIRQDKN